MKSSDIKTLQSEIKIISKEIRLLQYKKNNFASKLTLSQRLCVLLVIPCSLGFLAGKVIKPMILKKIARLTVSYFIT